MAFMKKKDFLILGLVFIFGLVLRYLSIYKANIVFDYDQIEDIFLTKRIVVDHDLPVIGRAIYGNPNLHHGIVYFYYNIIPFILFRWNPLSLALWNSIFNAGVSIILFFLAKSMFKRTLPAYISAILAATSYHMIQFSGWISSTTITIVTVPLFFCGLWWYHQKRKWGLVLALFFLGVSIQAELFFLYLIPIFAIYWLMFRPRVPEIRIFIWSVAALLLSLSTVVLTEIKLSFAGVKSLINFTTLFSDSSFTYTERFYLFYKEMSQTFAYGILPHMPFSGSIVLIIVILGLAVLLFSQTVIKEEKNAIAFLMLYLLSPVLMLFLGFHDHPWVLIGIIPVISLVVGYIISKIKYVWLIVPLLIIISISNISQISKGQVIFKPETSVVLASQLSVVDYTFQEAGGKPFDINAISYPLHHNGIWAYHYNWYGKAKYGYLPGWLGPQFDPLYKNLLVAGNRGKIYFLIMDKSYRIPEVHRENARIWANESGKLVSEKEINGFIVQKLIR